MNHPDFLSYSAKEPMTQLRRRFNNGECIFKTPPAALTAEEARIDAEYVQYVLENAYSGYTCFDRSLYQAAFSRIQNALNSNAQITPNALIDLICAELSFISDGHLSLTTQDYGKGFYQKLQTYVSDLRMTKTGEFYYDLCSGKQISFEAPVCVFRTIPNAAENAYLLGVRSKETVKEIMVRLDGKMTALPVHKIASREPGEETPLREQYEKDVAIITCSTFVGDSEELRKRLYEAGRKCRTYRHVIWDLSNNLGGNSELPKQFLLGLTGGFSDTLQFLQLQSTLVHAKEFGCIQTVPYQLEPICQQSTTHANLFDGELHIIINDRVASSAEIAIAWAASLPRVTFYGCNSLGIGRFGDLCIYELPNSKIILWCPQKIFDTRIAETEGFAPDYWIDDRDAASVVLDRLTVAPHMAKTIV